MSTAEDARRVQALVEQIGPLLHGQGPEVQSAILADLTAMWLAGHFCPDDPAATTRLRADLLDRHVRLIGHLIRPYEQRIMAIYRAETEGSA